MTADGLRSRAAVAIRRAFRTATIARAFATGLGEGDFPGWEILSAAAVVEVAGLELCMRFDTPDA
jgi:hypothetical protein